MKFRAGSRTVNQAFFPCFRLSERLGKLEAFGNKITQNITYWKRVWQRSGFVMTKSPWLIRLTIFSLRLYELYGFREKVKNIVTSVNISEIGRQIHKQGWHRTGGLRRGIDTNRTKIFPFDVTVQENKHHWCLTSTSLWNQCQCLSNQKYASLGDYFCNKLSLIKTHRPPSASGKCARQSKLGRSFLPHTLLRELRDWIG